MGSQGMLFSNIVSSRIFICDADIMKYDFLTLNYFDSQMTQRLKMYADSFAKASRLDFKPEIIH